MPSIPSVIKWTGSKRQQANFIVDLMPKHKRYFEPFLGGGSVLFLAQEKSEENPIASDIYSPLIELWLLIKNDPNLLIQTYKHQWDLLNTELDDIYSNKVENLQNLPKTFYDIRDNFNKTHNPLDLNFILRTCVNGIVRFNSSGDFNNSFHLTRRGMLPKTFEKNVTIWNKKIQNVDFLNQDYEETLNLASKGDLVYLDPPYLHSKNRYIDNLDVERFFKNLEFLNQKGVLWILSFDGSRDELEYNHEIPTDLFKQRLSSNTGLSKVQNLLSNKKQVVIESIYKNF